jgi:hypothetical protein
MKKRHGGKMGGSGKPGLKLKGDKYSEKRPMKHLASKASKI